MFYPIPYQRACQDEENKKKFIKIGPLLRVHPTITDPVTDYGYLRALILNGCAHIMHCWKAQTSRNVSNVV